MKIPPFITKQYPDGARGFKKEKRWQLRLLLKALDNLREGSAYFPSGTKHIFEIESACEELQDELSAKRWGR